MKEGALIKFLAIIMILMLLTMTFSTYSYAVDQNATGTITVSGLEPGVDVSIYKLTDVHIASNGQPESTPYTWVDGIEETFNELTGGDYTVEDFYNAYNEVKDNPDVDIEEMLAVTYASLAYKIRENGIPATKTKEVEGEPEYNPQIVADQTVTFENCEMGTYIILVENGYRIYAPAVVNLTPEFVDGEWVLNNATQDIVLKSSTPSITKTVTDETLTKDTYGTNDEIQFTVVADIPRFQGNLMKFYIGDKFTNGTIDMDSVEVYGVKGSTQDKLTGGNGYSLYYGNRFAPRSLTYEQVQNIDLDFTIEIIPTEDFLNYDNIKVVYTAKLNKDNSVNIGTEGNKNNAYLIYENNPYSMESSYQIQESSDTVYTYGVEVTKVDKTEETPLPGAEFNLLSGDTAQWFLPGDTAGVYYLANEGDTKGEVATAPETEGGEEPVTATQTLSVDGQGKLYIYGLDEGTYKLKETKAPDGYNIKTQADTIVISDTDKDGKLDGQVEGQEVDPNGTGIYEITVENSEGFQLPVTGGIGTVVFAATGIVVVGLGMTLLMIVFKKNRAEK